jgi:hypothetical protein
MTDPTDRPAYESTITCPCCGEVFEVIRHREPHPHGQATAMMCNDIRREHGRQKPECTRNPKWVKGWNIATVTVPLLASPAPSGGQADPLKTCARMLCAAHWRGRLDVLGYLSGQVLEERIREAVDIHWESWLASAESMLSIAGVGGQADQPAEPSVMLEVIYTWDDGREEVRYRRPSESEEAQEFRDVVADMQKRLGPDCPYSIRLAKHDLYKTGDKDATDCLKDSNGEVVLAQCRRCGKAESELVDDTCQIADQPAEPSERELPDRPGVWFHNGKPYYIFNSGVDKFDNPYCRELTELGRGDVWSFHSPKCPRGHWRPAVPDTDAALRAEARLAECKAEVRELREQLAAVRPFSGHKFDCDALAPMWHKGPCNCGWEEVARKLDAFLPLAPHSQHGG